MHQDNEAVQKMAPKKPGNDNRKVDREGSTPPF